MFIKHEVCYGEPTEEGKRRLLFAFKIRLTRFEEKGTLFATILFPLLCLLMSFPVHSAEENWDLKQSGIHIPGGFDINTLGELHGRVSGIHYLGSDSNTIIIELETTWEKYAVITCPPWYWNAQKIKVVIGEQMRVIGSKSLGKDWRLYVIAQEIHLLGQKRSISLRDKSGFPLWDSGRKGSRHGSGGSVAKR